MKRWLFPLKNYKHELPLIENGHKGAFGYKRKYHTHEGVDLYCELGDQVFAVESGTIINIRQFTGDEVGSPWWNKTWAVFVKGESGVVVYGEIIPDPSLKIGDGIYEGDVIGSVTEVLKTNKGNPTTMLHLELYSEEIDDAVEWKPDEEKPQCLQDPTPFLKSAKENNG